MRAIARKTRSAWRDDVNPAREALRDAARSGNLEGVMNVRQYPDVPRCFRRDGWYKRRARKVEVERTSGAVEHAAVAGMHSIGLPIGC